MKWLAIIVMLVGTLLLAGCQGKAPQTSAGVNWKPDVSASQSTASPSQTPESSPAASQAAPSLPPQFTVTFDDQKQVEQLICDYFSAIEKKDYAAAWKMTSAARQADYPEELVVKEHWGIESIKLVSMKGYLPPYVAQLFPPYEFHTTDVPAGVPTIWFEVELDITPSSNTAWENGENTRFVIVVTDDDGTWQIDGLPTGP